MNGRMGVKTPLRNPPDGRRLTTAGVDSGQLKRQGDLGFRATTLGNGRMGVKTPRVSL